MTCLFVGNLIKAASEVKLTSVFKHFGKCEVELKGPYAFIEYEDQEDAKNALKELNKTNLKGVNGLAKARIEFSKKKRGNGKLENNEVSVEEYDDMFSDHSDEDIINKNMNSNLKQSEERKETFKNSDTTGKSFREHKNKERHFDDKGHDEEISVKKRNMCFICKLPGHFAKDCILTKDSCFECGEKGHIAKECQAGVREAKLLTENRVKAILSQQSAFKFISPAVRIKNIVNYLNSNKSDNNIIL